MLKREYDALDADAADAGVDVDNPYSGIDLPCRTSRHRSEKEFRAGITRSSYLKEGQTLCVGLVWPLYRYVVTKVVGTTTS